jgi:hypothetical protein
MGIFISLVIALAFFLVLIIIASSYFKSTGKIYLAEDAPVELPKEKRIYKNLKPIGNYVGGHPYIDDFIQDVKYKIEDGDIILYSYRSAGFGNYKEVARIAITSINNVEIKDASQIHREVTLGRLLLVGIFSLAWRKKKVDEMSFVVIDWSLGKFSNQTTFVFEGDSAMQKANIVRNNLIRNYQKGLD